MSSDPRSASGDGAEHTVDLLARARGGDEAAWEQLYERYCDELYRRVHARLGPELRAAEESMDVFQSVWREAIGSLSHFEYRGEGSFLSWLATLLRNKLASRAEALRAVKRGATPPAAGSEVARAVPASPTPEPGPDTRADRQEDRELLLRATERLLPEQRELVRWALFDGLDHQDVARRLGIGVDAARMRVARATARLTAEALRLRGGSLAESDPSQAP